MLNSLVFMVEKVITSVNGETSLKNVATFSSYEKAKVFYDKNFTRITGLVLYMLNKKDGTAVQLC